MSQSPDFPPSPEGFGPGGQPPPEPQPRHRSEERTWAMLCHLVALVGYMGVPFGNVVGPLVVWLLKRDEYAEVDRHGKASLNFQISVLIYALVSALLVIVVIGVVLLPAVVVFGLVMTIVASVKTSNGTFEGYPLTIRFFQ